MDGRIIQTEDSDMKQNRILNYISAAGLLLAVCACGKENLNTTADGDNGGAATALPKGTFVVDYSVSDGETSRAFEGGLDANQRISSLLYLLYDSEGMLVKERVIPDITDETTWPLTRDKMTWEQREALKDTLNVEMTYTAVFLANTDAELFKDASGKAEQVFFYKTVMTGTDGTSETRYDNLKDVYLKLPSVPFNDKNMFYISKHTLSAKEADGTVVNDRETPYNCPVTLKRLVSRMDMERVAITITDETADDAVKAGIGTNFDNLLVNGLEKAFGDKVNELKSKPNVTADNCTNLLALLESKIGGKDIDNTIVKNNYESFISNLVDQFKQVNNYSLLVSPWTAFTTSEFTFESMHNRMSINDLTSSYDSNITSPIYTYQVTEGKATWIGFACNEAAKMSFTGITLKGETETAKINLIFDESKEIFLQKNGLVTCICNPIAEIKPKELSSGGTYFGYFEVKINMVETYGQLSDLLTEENGFRFDDTNTQTAFKNAIEGVFGKWNSDVSLSIKIPSSTEFTYTTTIE